MFLDVCKLTRDEKMREKSRVDLVRTLIEWHSLTSTKPLFQDPEMSQLSQDCGVELSQASALSISHLADTVEEPLSQVGNDKARSRTLWLLWPSRASLWMRRYCCKMPCTTSTTPWLMMLMPLFIISSSFMYELVCVSLIVRPLNYLLTTSYIGTAAV